MEWLPKIRRWLAEFVQALRELRFWFFRGSIATKGFPKVDVYAWRAPLKSRPEAHNSPPATSIVRRGNGEPPKVQMAIEGRDSSNPARLLVFRKGQPWSESAPKKSCPFRSVPKSHPQFARDPT